MNRPLEGLLAVSLERAVSAPFPTVRPADVGARVIELERREDDFARGYDNYVRGSSSCFVYPNPGNSGRTGNATMPSGDNRDGDLRPMRRRWRGAKRLGYVGRFSRNACERADRSPGGMRKDCL